MSMLAEADICFEIKPLPYSYDAVEPAISEQTMRLHHDKHYVGYLDTLNRLIDSTPYENMTLEEIVSNSMGAIFNNAAQVWNHEFYFDQFSSTPATEPSAELLNAINLSFGSFEAFKIKLDATAATHFGSGWIWLVSNEAGRLLLMNSTNAETPLRAGGNSSAGQFAGAQNNNLKPILTLDLWEHAYYKDYDNRRAEALSAHFSMLDWGVISGRL